MRSGARPSSGGRAPESVCLCASLSVLCPCLWSVSVSVYVRYPVHLSGAGSPVQCVVCRTRARSPLCRPRHPVSLIALRTLPLPLSLVFHTLYITRRHLMPAAPVLYPAGRRPAATRPSASVGAATDLNFPGPPELRGPAASHRARPARYAGSARLLSVSPSVCAPELALELVTPRPVCGAAPSSVPSHPVSTGETVGKSVDRRTAPQ